MRQKLLIAMSTLLREGVGCPPQGSRMALGTNPKRNFNQATGAIKA